MKKIIGVVGKLAAGKDTAAAILASTYAVPVVQVSDVLRVIARERGVPLDRGSLIALGRTIAHEHGGDFHVRRALADCPDRAIFAGMRQVEQIEFLRANTELLLIAIDAPVATRFSRVRMRAKPGDPESVEEFERIEEQDDTKGVQHTSACIALADCVVVNDCGEEEFAIRLEDVAREFF